MNTAAEQLAILERFVADLEPRFDRRSLDQLEHDAALESIAEEMRFEDEHPTEGDMDYFAARRAG